MYETSINKKNIPLIAVLAQVLHDPLHYYSLGFNRLKLISNIDNAIVYNTTGAHAAELRGGTFRRALKVV